MKMPFNITLSPPQLEVFLAPGQAFTQAYNITNNDSSPITLVPSVESWQAVGSDGLVQYLSADEAANTTLVNFSLANADTHLNQPFTIAPNSTRQIVLKITPRLKVQGDSYHTLFLTQVNPLTFHDTAALTYGKIGSHVLISVSPTEKVTYQARISQFTSSPFLKDLFFSDITLSATVDNAGEFYFKTIGDLTITKNGAEYKKFTLAPLNVAAHSSRRILCLSKPLPSGALAAEGCTLSAPFWPGVYTATLTLSDALNTPPLTRSFFVFPYYFALAATLITLLLVAYLKAIRHAPKSSS